MRAITVSVFLALGACAAGGCEWFGANPDPVEAPDPSGLTPVRGTAAFKVIQPELRQGIAFFNQREVKMYWDENTVLVKAGQALREFKPPQVGESFEFKGFEAHKEIALRWVEVK